MEQYTLQLSERELRDLKTILVLAGTKLSAKPTGEQAFLLESIMSIANKVDSVSET